MSDLVIDLGSAIAETVDRRGIERLERELLQLPQAEIPTEHLFGNGFYARTITIPKGAALTGKVHKTEHIFMVVRGDITLATDEGRKRVGAGYQAVCRPGLKRAGYAHEETVCVNVHITAEKDLARLEAELIEAEALEAPAVHKEIAP